LVHHGRIQRYDFRFSRHGIGKHHLGKSVRPLRSAPDSADRIHYLGRSSRAREPRDIANSVEGLAGLGGRVAFGFLGDRFGAKRVLVSGLLLQAFGALAYFFVRELGAFYAVAVLFGFIYAGVMPLYSVLARENFPQRMMGTIIGGTAMAGSLGMATGPLAGGLIYDTFASYRWLYIGAWGIGISAFVIALTFRPHAAKPTPALARAAG
jgi:MFS family permease